MSKMNTWSKIWSGAKAAQCAIDQLLGYLTWRDDRNALVIFNKDVSRFAALPAKLDEALREHPLVLREVQEKRSACHQGESRFFFRGPNDDEREILVHVFIFDMHC